MKMEYWCNHAVSPMYTLVARVRSKCESLFELSY